MPDGYEWVIVLNLLGFAAAGVLLIAELWVRFGARRESTAGSRGRRPTYRPKYPARPRRRAQS